MPRVDLETDRTNGRKRAMDMHASATRLLALPPDTFLLPGHAAGPVPFDRRPIVGTVRQVRERVPLLTQKRDEFVERLVRELPAVGALERAIVKANETGQSATLDASIEAGPHGCSSGLR